MTCERYRDALRDVAAGAAAPAGRRGAPRLLRGVPRGARGAAAGARRRGRRAGPTALGRAVARPRRSHPQRGGRVRRSRSPAGASAGASWLTAAAAAVVVVTLFVAQRGPRPEPPATVADRAPAHETPRATPAPETVAPETARSSQPVESQPRVSGRARAQRLASPRSSCRRARPRACFASRLPCGAVPSRRIHCSSRISRLPSRSRRVGEIQPLEIVPLDPTEGSGAE